MVVAVYITLCLIWGSTWLGITFVVNDVTPLTAAAVRFWIAVALFAVFHLFRRIKFPPDWASRLKIVAIGMPQIGASYAAVYWAEQHITSGTTAVLFAAFPFVVATVSAMMIASESWTRQKLIGLVCGAAGVTVVCFDPQSIDTTERSIAVAAVVMSAVVCGTSIVVIKKYLNHHDTVALTALQIVGGSLILSAAAIAFESPLSTHWTVPATVATALLALFGSAVAFFGYYWLLKRVDGTTASTITFVTPIVALFLGWVVRGERLSYSLLIGAALVLSGVWSVAQSGRRQARALREAAMRKVA